MAFGKGVFVGVRPARSADDERGWPRWTDRQLGEEGEHLNTVLWATDQFVAVGTGATFTSADGRTWSAARTRNWPLAVAFGAGVYVGSNWRGRLLHSTDAVAWRKVHKCMQHVEGWRLEVGEGRANAWLYRRQEEHVERRN